MSSLWIYGLLVLVCIAGFVVQVPLFLLALPFDHNRIVAGRWFRFLARSVVRCCWLWQFAVDGSKQCPTPGGAVVISNHESHCDAFLISSLGWEMKWLAKRSLFSLPVIGWLMALAGDVPLTRGDRASGTRAMQQLAAYLRRGMPVFLFPEGTRATSSELLPFKAGAFRLAIDAQVPIVPLAVAGTRTALAKHGWKFGRSRALVRVGTPIDTMAVVRAHTAESGCNVAAATAELAAKAREQINDMRRSLQDTLAIQKT